MRLQQVGEAAQIGVRQQRVDDRQRRQRGKAELRQQREKGVQRELLHAVPYVGRGQRGDRRRSGNESSGRTASAAPCLRRVAARCPRRLLGGKGKRRRRSREMETIGWLASSIMTLRRSDTCRRETGGEGKAIHTGKNETVGNTARSRAQYLGELGLLREPGNADVTKIKHFQVGKRVLFGHCRNGCVRKEFRWYRHRRSHLLEEFEKGLKVHSR